MVYWMQGVWLDPCSSPPVAALFPAHCKEAGRQAGTKGWLHEWREQALDGAGVGADR